MKFNGWCPSVGMARKARQRWTARPRSSVLVVARWKGGTEMRPILAIALMLISMTAFPQNTTWDYSTKTDISGRVTETAISWNLIVRCSKACEVYFIPDRYTLVEDQNTVLVKFNDKPVKRYGVSRSEDYTALFFSDPMSVLEAIRDNSGYMAIEYKPYQKTPDTVKYGVWNLPPTVLARIASWERKQRAPQAKKTTPQDTAEAKMQDIANQSEKEQACMDDAVKHATALPLSNDEFYKCYPDLDPNHKAEDAQSYKTKESCRSHGFFWTEQETDTQARGCWAKQTVNH